MKTGRVSTKVITAMIATVIATGIAAACGGSDGSGTAAVTADGTSFEVAVGDDFQIVLESNQSTGDRWVLSDELAAEVVEFVGETTQAADPDLIDAPTRQVITFRGVADGTAEIRLWAVGASGIPVEPVDRAEFSVTVG